MALPKSEMEQADAKVFENAAVISNSEVSTILSEYMRQRREEKPTFQPQPLVQKTLEYVQKFNCGNNQEAVQAMRNYMETFGLKPFEWGLIANLMPAESDEANKLIPSLVDNPDDPPEEHRGILPEELDRILAELQNLRHA
ncbi:DNA-directed RNA polymerase II subunit RPB4 [Tetrabaena socialis]|uniref:DNA-directed RNA polymerase II subunit RPB4 n=1 Tax=Tetrabaena socialis TaxID=47790 RepID=A0A2J8A7V1_9CHLO|nr:DNA-directed RNA polymerase II subunit RPB4 [Tetrabaena socialis]|eukprot:PNH08560.1 DNA-directed RNA polymerase II subunit RPB4 [Tetrabaena socialis]